MPFLRDQTSVIVWLEIQLHTYGLHAWSRQPGLRLRYLDVSAEYTFVWPCCACDCFCGLFGLAAVNAIPQSVLVGIINHICNFRALLHRSSRGIRRCIRPTKEQPFHVFILAEPTNSSSSASLHASSCARQSLNCSYKDRRVMRLSNLDLASTNNIPKSITAWCYSCTTWCSADKIIRLTSWLISVKWTTFWVQGAVCLLMTRFIYRQEGISQESSIFVFWNWFHLDVCIQ